jgi:hypothetical protein
MCAASVQHMLCLLLQLALEWCLLVQEVMLWQDWPPALFDKQPASERRNPLARVSTIATAGTAAAAAAGAAGADVAVAARTGPLFRGPRMKWVLRLPACCCSPTSALTSRVHTLHASHYACILLRGQCNIVRRVSA